MKNKKVLKLILMLIFLSIICFIILKNGNNEYKIKYDNKMFDVKEYYNKNYYYIEVKDEKNIYPIKYYTNEKNKRKIITNIYYFSNDKFTCLLPIIENDVYIDMQCYSDGILYNYHSIVGESLKLDEYVKTIEKYDVNKFTNSNDEIKYVNDIKIYNNFNKKVAITTYKGIISNNNEVILFSNDVYNNKLSVFMNDYYIVADYNQKYEFRYFYVVNLKNNSVFKIKSKEDISLDSYIQGVVDNKIYLYDIDNENQYELDIENKKIEIVSTDDKVKYFKNKKWGFISKVSANKVLYFDYKSLDNNFTDFDNVVETNSKFYLLKSNNVNYDLYEVDKENINILRYILTVPTINIVFNDDFLYYEYKSKIYYYSDYEGLKTILEDNELKFNNTIKYYIY